MGGLLNTKVLFILSDGNKVYDPEEGKYIISDAETIEKWCYVYDLSTEKVVQIYGRAEVRAVAFHHQGSAIEAAKVKIEDTTYAITSTTRLRNKTSYIASEVTT